MTVKKKTEVDSAKPNYKNILIRVGIGAIIGTVLSLVVDKYSTREVVCQVLAAEPESGMIAAKCIIK